MLFRKFARNAVGRDFVVGDIHGCFGKLRAALDEVGFDEARDRLFSVGDLVDRGPDSEAALSWLAKPWFHAVRGNHEQMAIDAANGRISRGLYVQNGGSWFLALREDLQRRFADAFEALPIAMQVETSAGTVGICHADCPTRTWSEFVARLGEQEVQNCALWDRSRFQRADRSGVVGLHRLYVGHTPLKAKTELGNVCYVDTGAVFGGALTIERIQERTPSSHECDMAARG